MLCSTAPLNDELSTNATRSSHDDQHIAQLVAQPVAGRVQPALDRADGAVELGAHLLNRAPLEVEGDEGPAVEIAQAVKTVADTLRILRLHDPFEGVDGLGRQTSQDGAVAQDFARTPDRPVDRQAHS